MYVYSLACVRVKGNESEWFRIVSGVRQGCIMSSWLFNVYMDTPGLLYADDLVLCGELKVGQFVEVCR